MHAKSAAAGRAFLGDATSRLLPMGIVFRYFAAAVLFHLMAWLALLAGAGRLVGYPTGPGWTLAALHLITLGVLVMSAMGASLQLLPVATLQAVQSVRLSALIWWLYTPGVAAIALGMGMGRPWLLGAGALAALIALLAYCALLALNLVRARNMQGMRGVLLHGWAALVSLVVALASALSLAAAWLGLGWLERATALALHVPFAAYGFMGLLALGLSGILVPMFALSSSPDERHTVASCLLVMAALALAGIAAFDVAAQTLRLSALALGGLALVLHLRQMLLALRSGLRRGLGRSFHLVYLSWGALGLSLLLAGWLVLGGESSGTATLFGLALIVGWLLSFLLGILQRIVPFLASLHGARSGTRPPTPSALTAQQPLAVHFYCHLAALAGLVAAVLSGSATLALAAAAVGALGAGALALFFVIVLQRMGARGSQRKSAIAQGV